MDDDNGYISYHNNSILNDLWPKVVVTISKRSKRGATTAGKFRFTTRIVGYFSLEVKYILEFLIQRY